MKQGLTENVNIYNMYIKINKKMNFFPLLTTVNIWNLTTNKTRDFLPVF